MYRSLFAVAGAAALSAVAAQSQGALRPQPYPGAFDDYLCTPTLVDSFGNAWTFDLTPVAATPVNISVNGNKYEFVAAGCGNPSNACVPQHDFEWTYGAGQQVFVGSAPSASCFDPASGAMVPCTANCEQLGFGAPLWSLINANNATVGVQATFAGARAGADDPSQCPYDPTIGTETPRTMVLQHYCDSSVPAGQIVTTNAYENPTCNYVITTRTAAACGVRGPANEPLPSPAVPAVPAVSNTQPFAPYLCQPVLPDSKGAKWAFNFSGLYSATNDYTYTVPSTGATVSINICGYASTMCAPNYPQQFNWGSAVYSFTQPDNSSVCALANSTVVPCTGACKVLGVGAPVWALLDDTNGATGGIAMQYWGAKSLPADPFQCPLNAGGQEILTSYSLNIACDPTVKGLQLSSFLEPAPCKFAIAASSAYACGVQA